MGELSTKSAKRFWPSLHPEPNVVVFGANGGIGNALIQHLGSALADGNVSAFSRIGSAGIEDENVVVEYATQAAEAGPIDVVIVATGILHDENGLRPEKRLADLNAANLARSFEINAIGPSLVAKHFLPLLRRDVKTVFVALSARVGSISDNRLGGWAAYRASKAALNMLLKTAAIEQRRSNPDSIVATLHPGTVDTPLSAPFQSNLKPGQLFTAQDAAHHIVDVIEALTPADSGGFFAWNGTPIEY
ncbi:MAG: SDR family NAD(P)-dependent oxidoreductase [Gammaproteobacteria bacterium]|nr:SDR family NAD(P)-dependent oxidoreductase [Gammaproteobacteria bacterium]